MNGKVRVVYSFRDDSYPLKRPIVFTTERIDKMVMAAKAKEINYYGDTDTYLHNALDKYRQEIIGKEGVDMGSISGWYAADILAHGAQKSFIIEYNKILSKHPRVIPLLKE